MGDQEETDRVRENRLRRMAERQGLRLERSPRRDPNDLGYGTYQLIHTYTRAVVHAGHDDQTGDGLDLDDVEEYLTGRDRSAKGDPNDI
jgi:hypothetical protein